MPASFLGVFVLLAALLGGGCASLPVDFERVESHALADTKDTSLGREVAGTPAIQAGQSTFRPLPRGVDALLARIVLAGAAERSLDVMYYKWKDDLTGRHLAHAVLQAADRGVRVRVLLDDLGSDVDDNQLVVLGSHPRIQVRLFNPLATRGATRSLEMLADFDRINRRMHNKAFIADNQRAVIGGRNVADEYFEASSDANFGDLDVGLAGPVVPQISAAFDAFWNSPMAYPIAALSSHRPVAGDLDGLREMLAGFIASESQSPYVQRSRARWNDFQLGGPQPTYAGLAQFVYDDPEKVSRDRSSAEGRLLPQFATLGLPLDRELTIISPYFIPGQAGVDWLTALVRRGVRVTVLTNSLVASDVPAVHAGYARYREALLEGGVRLYEFRPEAFNAAREQERRKLGGSTASLHTKAIFFDRQAAFIGSLNLDPRSVQLNTEMGAVCHSAEMTKLLLERLEANLDLIAWRVERQGDEQGRRHLVWHETGATGARTYTQEPEASGWLRFKVWLLGILPVESQL
ncbi:MULTISPECIES: phospholipase D family protein [Ramlibacter]|uniref:Phospholipase D family protein n=1 Tax=Ramlibacter pinisoli TaxID=2682844 RepID=A0A6N8IXV3_9BURK|nr:MULTISPECIES: phospholipase D family protein [Ramlibacter]MBA2960924.1 phospholipase D family protein [Ramlibacter sp. CGMCC 1.13660]MVQ30870.1 phospholipase D family protein [Ramlibacter pinisoli]